MINTVSQATMNSDDHLNVPRPKRRPVVRSTRSAFGTWAQSFCDFVITESTLQLVKSISELFRMTKEADYILIEIPVSYGGHLPGIGQIARLLLIELVFSALPVFSD
jgi:hypothetical protein